MADCVKRNADKADPHGYCATVMRAVEKAEQVHVLKLDEDRQLVFGWASVAITKDGQTLVDRQGDIIPTAELEDAAYDYVLEYREADEMHAQITKGHLVESLVVTPEKLQALGLPGDALPVGWWVGFKLDRETFQKVKDGRLRMFSIEGAAERVAA